VCRNDRSTRSRLLTCPESNQPYVLALARRASEGLIAEGGRRAGQASAERGQNGRIELRRDVSAYLQAARAKGTSPNQLAPALGLSLPTAYEWSSKKGERPGKSKSFQRMSVVPQPATGEANAIVVTGPGGLRAVGLGVAELAELLQRLGC
jgi:hypothetical protein